MDLVLSHDLLNDLSELIANLTKVSFESREDEVSSRSYDMFVDSDMSRLSDDDYNKVLDMARYRNWYASEKFAGIQKLCEQLRSAIMEFLSFGDIEDPEDRYPLAVYNSILETLLDNSP